MTRDGRDKHGECLGGLLRRLVAARAVVLCLAS